MGSILHAETYKTDELKNGIQIIHENRSTPPVMSLVVMIPGGSSHESSDQHGLARMTAKIMESRTESMSMSEFNDYVSRHGLKVSSSVHPDFTEFTFTGTTQYKTELLDLIPEILSEPALDEDVFEYVKRTQLASLAKRKDNTFRHAFDLGLEAFYGEHPYNHPAPGTMDTVRSFTPENVESFFEANYNEDNMVVSAVGDLSLGELKNSFQSVDFPESSPELRLDDYSFPATERVQEERDLDQPSHVLIYPGPSIDSRHYVDAKVLDAILGGGMDSLLFNEMREQRSLGYQVGSSFPSRRFTSSLRIYLGGGSDDGEEFRSALDTILQRFMTEGPTEEELNDAQEYLKGTLMLDHETNSQTAWYRAFYEVMGRSHEFDDQYPELIEETDTESVQKAAQHIFKEANPAFVTIKPNQE